MRHGEFRMKKEVKAAGWRRKKETTEKDKKQKQQKKDIKKTEKTETKREKSTKRNKKDRKNAAKKAKYKKGSRGDDDLDKQIVELYEGPRVRYAVLQTDHSGEAGLT